MKHSEQRVKPYPSGTRERFRQKPNGARIDFSYVLGVIAIPYNESFILRTAHCLNDPLIIKAL